MKKFTFLFFAIITLAGMLAISGCKKKATYKVTFDANGGTGEMSEQIFTEGEARALISNTFSYRGYTFDCWNTVPDGSGTSYDDQQSITVSSDMILYAQWKKIITFVTVTFDANGGSGEMASQRYVVGTAQALKPNEFTKENCHFAQWSTSADGRGTVYYDTQEITVSSNITLYAQWRVTTGEANGHIWVDLGLSSGTLWAAYNVGATSPEDYGTYFAWGETTPKEIYDWSTYLYCDGGYDKLTKYCTEARFGLDGFTDNLTSLEPTDDAATANWGEGWRMPTNNEMRKLCTQCEHKWTTVNGVSGMEFKGRNGNSIFIPAAGIRNESVLELAGSDGLYWSKQLDTFSPSSWYFFVYSDNCSVEEGTYRYAGLPVRAVYSPHK